MKSPLGGDWWADRTLETFHTTLPGNVFFCHDEKPPDQTTWVKLNYCCLKKFHKTSKLQSCPHDSWKIHFVSLCLWCPGRKEIKRTRHLPDDCVLLDLSREESVILTRLWLRGGIYHSGKRRQVLWVRVEFSDSQFFLCSRKKTTLSSLRESPKPLCIELQVSKLLCFFFVFFFNAKLLRSSKVMPVHSEGFWPALRNSAWAVLEFSAV